MTKANCNKREGDTIEDSLEGLHTRFGCSAE